MICSIAIYGYAWNVHRLFITYIHKNIGISKHEKHLRLLSSDTKLFITFEFKVLRHKERDTNSFYSGFVISTPISCDTCPRPPRASKSQPFSPEAGLNSTQLNSLTFSKFQNPPCASGAWRHSHSVAPFPIWAIVTSLSDMSAPRMRVNTCINVAPK